jgi:hypothetical protein
MKARRAKFAIAYASFLAQHGYRNGAVTIDASDWYYDHRLGLRLRAQRDFDVTLYRQPYLGPYLGPTRKKHFPIKSSRASRTLRLRARA